tara:strand:+ start:197 stop:601 length:405 start_codon:yes stop_codon:yes gene_type:complete
MDWKDAFQNNAMIDTTGSQHTGTGGYTIPAQAFGLHPSYRFVIKNSPNQDPNTPMYTGGFTEIPMFVTEDEAVIRANQGSSVILLQELLKNNPRSPEGAMEMEERLQNFYKVLKNKEMDTIKQIEKPLFEEGGY